MGSKYTNNGVPTRLTTAGADVVTVPDGNRQKQVLSATLTNTSGSDEFVNIWIMNSGDTPADDKLLTKEKGIPSGESVTIQDLLGKTLTSGQRIYADCSADSAVNITLSTIDLF